MRLPLLGSVAILLLVGALPAGGADLAIGRLFHDAGRMWVEVRNDGGEPAWIVNKPDPGWGVFTWSVTAPDGTARAVERSGVDWLVLARDVVVVPGGCRLALPAAVDLAPGTYRISVRYHVAPTSPFIEPWRNQDDLEIEGCTAAQMQPLLRRLHRRDLVITDAVVTVPEPAPSTGR